MNLVGAPLFKQHGRSKSSRTVKACPFPCGEISSEVLEFDGCIYILLESVAVQLGPQ